MNSNLKAFATTSLVALSLSTTSLGLFASSEKAIAGNAYNQVRLCNGTGYSSRFDLSSPEDHSFSRQWNIAGHSCIDISLVSGGVYTIYATSNTQSWATQFQTPYDQSEIWVTILPSGRIDVVY